MLMNFKRKNLIALILCIIMLLSIISLAAYEPFKVELTLFERYMCMGLFRLETNFADLLAIREIKEELSATEEESKLAGLSRAFDGGTSAENWDAVKPKEIVFGDITKNMIVDALKKLDENEKLTNQHFSLYVKFIIEPNKAE